MYMYSLAKIHVIEKGEIFDAIESIWNICRHNGIQRTRMPIFGLNFCSSMNLVTE